MPFLICVVAVCPLRAEASHRSEQVSQLLFGELCEMVDRDTDFVKVKVIYDNYEGWCHQNQLEVLEDNYLETTSIASAWVNEIRINNKVMYIPFGSTLRSEFINRKEVIYNGESIQVSEAKFEINLLNKTCFTFLNTSYLWGGRSVFGIDCSGFTQMVYKCMNIPLCRDASQQAGQGDEVAFLQEVKPGDLAFFDNEQGRITHVGILLGSDKIIHASGRVRVDTIDSDGIINSDNGKRTHRLRLIKRIAELVEEKLF